MPKAKKKIPTVKPYGKENLKSALEAVRNGSTIRQALQTFRVPKSIIQTKLSGKYPENCRNGRPTTRFSEIEESLVGLDTWMSVQMEFYSKRSSPGLEGVQILCKMMNLSNKRMEDQVISGSGTFSPATGKTAIANHKASLWRELLLLQTTEMVPCLVY
ncbi:hypothetical protein DMENIID0001_021060 [Sergentomyia squamirostris]